MGYIKLFLMAIVVVLSFSACGGGDSFSTIKEKESGIAKIKNYSNNGKTNKLTVDDYRNANFHAVTSENIEEYNILVDSLGSNDNLEEELDKLDTRLNLKPTANAQNIKLNRNTKKNIILTGQDEDVANLAYVIVTQPKHGTLKSTYATVSGKMAHFTYTPSKDYYGSDTFSFKVFDGKLYSDVVNVGITIINTTIPNGNSKITGVIQEIGTNRKLDNVKVIIKDTNNRTRKTTSNANGVYTFTNLIAGSDYNIEYKKENYSSMCYKNIDLEENQSKTLEIVNLSKDSDILDGVVSGKITNALNHDGVGEVTLKIRNCINNVDGATIAETKTTDNGGYDVTIPHGSYTIEAIKNGFISSSFTIISIGGDSKTNQNGSISPVLAEGEMRIVLTWGASPNDLDSHLIRTTDGQLDYHIDFNKKGIMIQDAILDTDDTSAYGPETVTIYNPRAESVYSYYIHDYSNRNNSESTALKNSNAKVDIFSNNIRKIFNVPNENGKYWKVFDIINGNIVPCTTNCVRDNI